MVFYMPLSHLLSFGLMVGISNSTAVPVSCVPGGANFTILLPNIAAGLAIGTSL